MKRKFTKYPQGYVKATSADEEQMVEPDIHYRIYEGRYVGDEVIYDHYIDYMYDKNQAISYAKEFATVDVPLAVVEYNDPRLEERIIWRSI